jgi:thioredoxin-related protein
MKSLFYLLSAILIAFACLRQIPEKPEIKFINESVKRAKSENKLLIIEFWAPECGPCMRLKYDIFENEKVRELIDKNFVLVQVSPSDSVYKPLWKRFNLKYQSTVIYLDMNGNELDRTVSYDGKKDSYLNFLEEVSRGTNLYSVVFSTYKKDTLNVNSNFVLAKKLLFRYQMEDAVKHFNKVLLYDPDNKFRHNPESRFRIAECDLLLTANTSLMKEYVKSHLNKQFVPKAYEYLINDLINRKDKEHCISLCVEALSKYPGSYEILNKYAWAICTFKIKDDYEKALHMAQKSISIYPERAGTYSTEAWIHYEMGNKEKAIELQNKAIDIYPSSSYIHDLELFNSAHPVR